MSWHLNNRPAIKYPFQRTNIFSVVNILYPIIENLKIAKPPLNKYKIISFKPISSEYANFSATYRIHNCL